MSLDACAAQVARGDPDRFAAAMTAPLPARGDLMALYAFNLEVARAPWVTEEPLIAEMRLQWWADAVEEIYAGAPPRAHEVVAPLADAVRRADLPRAPLDAAIAARREDIGVTPPVDLWAYLRATGGGLAVLAGRTLGARAEHDTALEGHGAVIAAAGYLGAVPQIRARGRSVFVPGVHGPQADLAREALAQRADLIPIHRLPRRLRPALLHGWAAARILRRVAGGQAMPEAAARGPRFLWAALTGRF
ncbi:MAG: squalene/phytoene synthase family protein [Pseudomonadota bacterium]